MIMQWDSGLGNRDRRKIGMKFELMHGFGIHSDAPPQSGDGGKWVWERKLLGTVIPT
jgi:hypothetical protein